MKKIFAFLLFLTATIVFSQEMLVPFRVGDKFGLSDINGKMKLDAKYDWLGVEKNTVFTFRAGNSSGVISGTKEIVSLPDNYSFSIVKDKFIIASIKKNVPGSRNKQETKLLYNFKGQSLINEPLVYLKVAESFGGSNEDKNNIFLFRGLNPEKQETLYVYDSDKQKITDKLLENSKRIDVADKDFATKQLFIVRTTSDGQKDSFVIEYKSGKINIAPVTGKEVTGRSRRSGEKEISVVEINPDHIGHDVVPDMPTTERAESLPKTNYYNTTLSLENKTITAIYKGYYSQKEIVSKTIELPAKSIDIVRGNWLQTFTSPGKSQNVYNYVTYSLEGKKGIFITDTLHIKPKYDHLTLVKFKNGNGDLPVLIVGNKNAAGVMKYGIINTKDEILVPLQFDKIDYLEDENYSRGKSVKTLEDYMVVQKGGKYGIINYKNVELLPVKYTDIIRKSNSYSTTYTLRNGDKYGVLKFEMKTKKDFADALFPYPVGDIIKDFAGIKGKDMIVLEKGDKLFCYAHPDGFLYYKP